MAQIFGSLPSNTEKKPKPKYKKKKANPPSTTQRDNNNTAACEFVCNPVQGIPLLDVQTVPGKLPPAPSTSIQLAIPSNMKQKRTGKKSGHANTKIRNSVEGAGLSRSRLEVIGDALTTPPSTKTAKKKKKTNPAPDLQDKIVAITQNITPTVTIQQVSEPLSVAATTDKWGKNQSSEKQSRKGRGKAKIVGNSTSPTKTVQKNDLRLSPTNETEEKKSKRSKRKSYRKVGQEHGTKASDSKPSDLGKQPPVRKDKSTNSYKKRNPSDEKIPKRHQPPRRVMPYHRKPYKTKVGKSEDNGVFPILSLPRELRDIIISHAINFDGVDLKILEFNNSFPSMSHSKGWRKKVARFLENLAANPPRTTPTIFLLNHQIYNEAKEMLPKKTLRITVPPRYPMTGQLGLFSFVGNETLENICRVSFSLRTYPVDAGKGDMLAPDWRGKDLLSDEFLEDSFPWAVLLKHCIQTWWRSQKLRSFTISIQHYTGNWSEYNLSVSRDMLSAFENCMYDCLCSLDLDGFVAFLIYANVPVEVD